MSLFFVSHHPLISLLSNASVWLLESCILCDQSVKKNLLNVKQNAFLLENTKQELSEEVLSQVQMH